ncbi:MAG: hypothetical protein QW250_05675, partial [Sulfolobaceae archaeon]
YLVIFNPFLMSTYIYKLSHKNSYVSTVYSIRIPKKLKELMDSVNVDWQKEISNYIEERVRKELIKSTLRRVKRI